MTGDHRVARARATIKHMSIAYEARRNELGDFLRRRREALLPEEVGITIRDRRRTPGLRRNEVAARANMSVIYYEQLERGRGPMPSPAMLGGIAKALRLNAEESDYVHRLVGQQTPAAAEPSGFVDPRLLLAMDAVSSTVVATVTDDLSTVLAQNTISVHLFGPMAGAGEPRSNLIWRWFTDPRWRDRVEAADQQATSRFYVADLRTSVARRYEDGQASSFLNALLEQSEDFRQRWAEHAVSTPQCTLRRIDDERVGPIDLACTMVLSPLSSQRLTLLQPAPGTDAGERLTRLRALIG